MKRFLISVFFLLPLLCSAHVIDEPSCRKIASEILGSARGVSGDVSLELVRTGGFSNASGTSPEYYIYNNSADKGFVIVSADPSVAPVLGYSTECSYDTENLPENFISWMQMWDRIIAANRKAGIGSRQPSGYVSYSSLPAECLLETALWGQSAPYNDLCPKEGNARCVTGCTATATCIVMRYHKWPDAGVGSLPSYSYYMDSGKRNSVDGIELGEKYDWDNMLMNYDKIATAQQKKAVALLMQHIGIMLKSQYNAAGTGAYPDDVPVGLVSHMKYDRSTEIFGASNYTPAVWIEKLKSSINSNYPVIYSGYSATNGGHCFVLDGYNAKNEMHINFGWDGQMNGYFAFPEFSEFTIGHAATFNAHKDEGGPCPDNIEINGSGLSSNIKEFHAGEKFNVNISYLANLSAGAAFNGELVLAKADSKDNVQETIGHYSVQLPARIRTTVKFTDVSFTTKPKIGDKLIVLYKSDLTPQWEEVPFDRESSTVGELALADPYSIEETTLVRYNVSTGETVVKTKEGVTMSLCDSTGAIVTDGVTVKGYQMTVNAKALKEDIYIIKLSKGEEYKELKVKLGTKE